MTLKRLNSYQKKTIEVENVIIGSGAGGSTTAIELLKKKKKSIILEEGPKIHNLPYGNIGKNIVKFYRNNGATPMISFNGGPIIGYGQGSCVGGSTFVNAGYFSNTPEWIFDNWLKKNHTKISYKYFLELIDEIRSEIPVSIEKLTNLDHDSNYLDLRSQKLGWKIEKCERFSTGKPGESKQSMNLTYHKTLDKNEVDILYNCKVLKIKVDNKMAKSLIVTDTETKINYNINLKNLFISCGPINSPHLLIKNKLIKYSKNQNTFQFHINFKIIVKFKKKINSNFSRSFNPSSPVSIFFMREFEKEGVLLSAANSEIPYLLATLSHFGDEIKYDLYNNFENYAMYVYQIKSNSFGQVKDFLNIPFVNYRYADSDLFQIKLAIKRLSKFFLEDEAEFILFPVEDSPKIKNLKQSYELADNLNIRKLHLVSVHGMGSLRPGEDDYALTNFSGKLKNFENIFINDASILPGNTGESPQASIMAMVKNNVKSH